jgi:hypothetical protein
VQAMTIGESVDFIMHGFRTVSIQVAGALCPVFGARRRRVRSGGKSLGGVTRAQLIIFLGCLPQLDRFVEVTSPREVITFGDHLP